MLQCVDIILPPQGLSSSTSCMPIDAWVHCFAEKTQVDRFCPMPGHYLIYVRISLADQFPAAPAMIRVVNLVVEHVHGTLVD